MAGVPWPCSLHAQCMGDVALTSQEMVDSRKESLSSHFFFISWHFVLKSFF